MVKAAQIVKGKVLKKSWHPILSTKAFNSTLLGETYVVEPAAMTGMHLTVNLANLTGDIRQQGISLKFRVQEVDNGSGIAAVIGYEASPSQLRRLVRRGVERMDDSVECRTSEGKLIVVKPFAVTRASTGKSKISLVRKNLRAAIISETAKHTFDDIVKNVISHEFQNLLKGSIKKILPLRALEIRRLEVVSGKQSAPKETAPEGKKKATAEKAEAKKEAAAEKKEEVEIKEAAEPETQPKEETEIKDTATPEMASKEETEKKQ